MAATDEQAPWEELWSGIDKLASALARSGAVNVNSDKLRAQAKEIVQLYFRSVRPQLSARNGELTSSMDAEMQHMLRLAIGRNPKRSYQAVIRNLKRLRPTAESVMLMPAKQSSRLDGGQVFVPSNLEQAILRTLEKLVPTAALSYRQVLQDLHERARVSHRGTAADLREVLREVLDHLAPDDAVEQSPGFKVEDKQTKPTMRQKARFILRARGASDKGIKTSEQSLGIVEDGIAGLARTVYDRGSLGAHLVTTRREVATLKNFADAVLAELLQVHESE